MGLSKNRASAKFFSTNSRENKCSVDLDYLFCYVAKGYGRPLAEIKELDIIDFYQMLRNLVQIEKRKRANQLYDKTISSGAGFGNKKAFSIVKKILEEIKKEELKTQLKNERKESQGVLVSGNILSKEDLKTMVQDFKNGRK